MNKEDKELLSICKHIEKIEKFETYTDLLIWIAKENYLNTLKNFEISIKRMYEERMLQIKGYSQAEIIELMLKEEYEI